MPLILKIQELQLDAFVRRVTDSVLFQHHELHCSIQSMHFNPMRSSPKVILAADSAEVLLNIVIITPPLTLRVALGGTNTIFILHIMKSRQYACKKVEHVHHNRVLRLWIKRVYFLDNKTDLRFDMRTCVRFHFPVNNLHTTFYAHKMLSCYRKQPAAKRHMGYHRIAFTLKHP